MDVAVFHIAVSYATWTHEKKILLFSESLVILVSDLALWHSDWAPKSLSKLSDVWNSWAIIFNTQELWFTSDRSCGFNVSL